MKIPEDFPKRHRSKNKVQIRGVFFITTKRAINSPRFTTQPPQIHHKNTTPKTHVFSEPPSKTPAKQRNSPPPPPRIVF
jgi:hypothetical protein